MQAVAHKYTLRSILTMPFIDTSPRSLRFDSLRVPPPCSTLHEIDDHQLRCTPALRTAEVLLESVAPRSHTSTPTYHCSDSELHASLPSSSIILLRRSTYNLKLRTRRSKRLINEVIIYDHVFYRLRRLHWLKTKITATR